MASVSDIIKENSLELDYDTFRAKYGEALWSKYRNEQLNVEIANQKKALTAERVSPPATDFQIGQQALFVSRNIPLDIIIQRKTPSVQKLILSKSPHFNTMRNVWDSFCSSEEEE